MRLDTREKKKKKKKREREREHICSLRELKEGNREARLCEAILA